MKCKGIFGLLFGHAYEPVFEEEQKGSTIPSETNLLNVLGKALGEGDAYSLEPIMDLIDSYRQYKTNYYGHVCLRCGHKVKRES